MTQAARGLPGDNPQKSMTATVALLRMTTRHHRQCRRLAEQWQHKAVATSMLIVMATATAMTMATATATTTAAIGTGPVERALLAMDTLMRTLMSR